MEQEHESIPRYHSLHLLDAPKLMMQKEQQGVNGLVDYIEIC